MGSTVGSSGVLADVGSSDATTAQGHDRVPPVGTLVAMQPDDGQEPDEAVEPAPTAPERGESRSARAAKVAAVQRARGNSTGPNDRLRAPKTIRKK